MKRWLTAMGLVLAMVGFAALPVMAQENTDDQGNPNNPAVNDRANACFAGGSMQGQCDDELKWTAGWHLIRFEKGLLKREDVPDWANWVLPPLLPPPPVSGSAGGPVEPPQNCSMTLSNTTLSLTGIATNPITIPLNVVNGSVDPNDTFGVSPYGFNWSGSDLLLFGPGGAAPHIWSFGSWISGFIVSTDCPNATPPTST